MPEIRYYVIAENYGLVSQNIRTEAFPNKADARMTCANLQAIEDLLSGYEDWINDDPEDWASHGEPERTIFEVIGVTMDGDLTTEC